MINTFEEISKIDKGWSSDEKYYLETYDVEKYLLRINSIEKQDVKEKEFKIMKEVSKVRYKYVYSH